MLIGFLAALVAADLLGVPTLVVLGGGALLATLAILAFRGHLEAAPRRRPATPSDPAARQYVPSVLEGSSMRRRRGGHLPRRRRPGQPLRIR